MKAWEICKKENVGKVYKDSEGREWEVIEPYMSCEYDLRSKVGYLITDSLIVSEIAKLDFEETEEIIDWSKVQVDTKILVKEYKNNDWVKRYFAKFDGNIYAWNNGKTSFTALENEKTAWKYAKLYEEGEE